MKRKAGANLLQSQELWRFYLDVLGKGMRLQEEWGLRVFEQWYPEWLRVGGRKKVNLAAEKCS